MVFALKHVAEEEANTIRGLLADNHIEFYETSVGRWQISLAALWVPNNDDYARARELIEQDQQQRQSTAIVTKADIVRGILNHAKQNPVEFVFTVVAIGFVVGLSVLPFIV